MKTLHVLLPSRERAGISPGIARRLVRADLLPVAPRGWLPALRQLFTWPGADFPAGAWLREAAAGDAGGDPWVAADPAWIEADINGARMLACGQLELTRTEADALAATLRPVLGDAGMLLEVTTPDRWQLRLRAGADSSAFAPPDAALGTDILSWIEGAGPIRAWRRLFTEVQTELHEHPVNRARRERGAPPCTALWFWGGGRLPPALTSDLGQVLSTDPLLQAMTGLAGAELLAVGAADAAGFRFAPQSLLDLGHGKLQDETWDGLLGLLHGRRVDALQLLFSSGERLRLRRAHRWRFWRRHR